MAEAPENREVNRNGGATTQVNVTPQEKEDVYRTRLFEIITDILNTGMDISLTLVDINCEKKNECLLYKNSIEIVRRLRELKELTKQMKKK